MLNQLSRIKLKVEKLSFSEMDRVFIISDIHGNYDLVDQLLKKHNVKLGQDYLLILGDLTLKGPMPLKTLRYVRDLAKYRNVYVLMGNCDETELLILESENLDQFKWFIDYHQQDRMNSLAFDMLRELYGEDYLEKTHYDYVKLQTTLKEHYASEYTFIEQLPHVIETEKYLFVHANVPVIVNYELNSYKDYIGGRDLYKKGHNLNKIVVCGHMPTTIFRKNYYCDNILIDDERRMIFIDGGMVVKKGGQLNFCCLVGNNLFQLDASDRFVKRKTLKSQKPTEIAKGTCWPYYKINKLQKDEHFTKCLMPETLEIVNIKNEYLNNDETSTIDDCPSSLLEVEAGDVVTIIDEELSGYALAKKAGTIGWIKKEYLGGINDENKI